MGASEALAVNGGTCVGDVVTLSKRMGSLIDAKAIAIGDRVKVRSATATAVDYQTRTVDKVWGSNLDVTLFTVDDPYDADGTTITASAPSEVDAWVDESGSTEDLECGRRGSATPRRVCASASPGTRGPPAGRSTRSTSRRCPVSPGRMAGGRRGAALLVRRSSARRDPP